jgi:UDP-glucose:(heptosyl)LPS alpha-1,3-glucosyltransferase
VHGDWLATREPVSLWRSWWRRRTDARELALEQDTFARARVVAFNAPAPRASAIARGLIDDARSVVVRNGVDLLRFRPDAGARGDVRKTLGVRGRLAVFLANGFERKGFDMAWRAFQDVASPADRLAVVGRAEPHRVREAAMALGDQVFWVGPTRDPQIWLAAADAVLHPTRYDAAANLTLEALACGAPVITTWADGNADVVPDARLVVSNPRDRLGLSEALRYAWSVTGPAREALRAAVEPWTVERNAGAFEAVCEAWR